MREFSTVCTSKIEAQAVGAAEEARRRGEFLDTGTVIEPVRVITIHDCIAAYRSRPGSLHRFDVQRLDEFDATIGNHHLSRAPEAWSAWLRNRGRGLAPSTIARWRSTLLAALTYGAEEYGGAIRSLRSVRGVDAELEDCVSQHHPGHQLLVLWNECVRTGLSIPPNVAAFTGDVIEILDPLATAYEFRYLRVGPKRMPELSEVEKAVSRLMAAVKPHL